MGRGDYRGGGGGGGYYQGGVGGGGGNRGGGGRREGGGYGGGGYGGGGGGGNHGGYSGGGYQQQGRGYQGRGGGGRYQDGGNRGRGGGGGGGSGSGGGSARGGRQQEVSWRDVAYADLHDERPRWVLSCYAHEREHANDLAGDISPEEVRWANVQAAQRGVPATQLAAELKAAVQARMQLFNQLLRASKPPSLGGPTLPLPTASISGLQDVGVLGGFGGSSGSGFCAQPTAAVKAGGFGQAAQPAAGGFGDQPAGFGQSAQPAAAFGQAGFAQPTQPTPAFGQAAPAAAGFGQAGQPPSGLGLAAQPAGGFRQKAPPVAGFGQQQPATSAAAGGFGGAFGTLGTSKPVFGQHKAGTGFGSTPFGQPARQPAFGSTPFGQQPAVAVAAPTTSTAFTGGLFGSSAAAATAPGFGAFGQGAVAGFRGLATTTAVQQQPPQQGIPGAAVEAAQAVGANDADVAVWTAATFETRKIPEHAPPPVYCR